MNLPPHGRSIYYGLSGQVYYHLRNYQKNGDEVSFKALRQFDEIAIKVDTPFGYNIPLVDASNQKVTGSFFLGPLGEAFIRILVRSELGSEEIINSEPFQTFNRIVKNTTRKHDVLLGKAGQLIACSLLRDKLGKRCPSDVFSIGDNLNDQLFNKVRRIGKLRVEVSIPNYSFAHGWAGLLYSLLMWSNNHTLDYLNEALESFIISGIKTKEEFWMPSSGIIRVSQLSWCNGSAGYIFLFLLAYAKTRLKKYLSIAQLCGNFMIAKSDLIPRDISLCCGVSGELISLLQLSKSLDDDRFYHFCLNQLAPQLKNTQTMILPNSLFLGQVGSETVQLEMDSWEQMRFPFIQ